MTKDGLMRLRYLLTTAEAYNKAREASPKNHYYPVTEANWDYENAAYDYDAAYEEAETYLGDGEYDELMTSYNYAPNYEERIEVLKKGLEGYDENND